MKFKTSLIARATLLFASGYAAMAQSAAGDYPAGSRVCIAPAHSHPLPLKTNAVPARRISQWNVSVSQLLKVGKQAIQLSLGAKYYADKPNGGPDWGLRLTVTFLFPKGFMIQQEQTETTEMKS